VFSNKIKKFHASLFSKTILTSADVDTASQPLTFTFCHFTPALADEVSKLIALSADTIRDPDPTPTSRFKMPFCSLTYFD
jgi:hypothetical protein